MDDETERYISSGCKIYNVTAWRYIMLQPKDIGCCGCNINSRNSSANRQYSISMYGKRRDYNQWLSERNCTKPARQPRHFTKYLNSEGTIIYVGKAKNLKRRVSSYFNREHPNGKTRLLVSKIADIPLYRGKKQKKTLFYSKTTW